MQKPILKNDAALRTADRHSSSSSSSSGHNFSCITRGHTILASHRLTVRRHRRQNAKAFLAQLGIAAVQ